YLEVDNNEVINEMSSDTEIVILVHLSEEYNINYINDDDSNEITPIILNFQALIAFDTYILYFEQQFNKFNLNVKDLHRNVLIQKQITLN
ncbi:3567_t:CDS:1, partial [Funneliformis geosporum]